MKTRSVLLPLVCVALVSSFAVFGAQDTRAQSASDWQAVSERLARIEDEITSLLANFDEEGDAEVSQRLSRLEELLRENTGMLETLTFRLGQLQQSSTAYRRDVELRFQILEDDLISASERLNALATALRSASVSSAAVVSAPAEAAATATTPSALTSNPVTSTAVTSTIGAVGAPSTLTGVAPGAAVLGTLSARGTEGLQPEFGDQNNVEGDEGFSFFDSDDSGGPAPEPIDVPDGSPGAINLLGENAPRPLGAIPLDEGQSTPESGDQSAPESRAATSADPDAIYRESFSLLEQSDFEGAREGFLRIVSNHPDHENAADANYWAGEIFLAQGDYAEAAKSFLNVRQSYGNSERASDSMLKLGVSLRFLEEPERACGVFDELLAPGRFDLSDTVRRRAELERQLTGC